MTRRYDEGDPAAAEVELPKGDVTEGVVRVGDAILRRQAWLTERCDDLLAALRVSSRAAPGTG